MSRSVPALATPTVLEFARVTAGFDLETAARRVGATEDRLSMWEQGGEGLTLAKLKKLAALYRRPLAFFYLPEAPLEVQRDEDYRSATIDDPETRAEVTLQVRRIRELRDVALRLEMAGASLGAPIPQARLDERPAEVAARLRGWLAVDIVTQRAWKDAAHAFRGWRSRLEALGVLVFQFTGVSVRTARGFSIAGDRLPVLAVNSQDFPVARSFTLMHELAHLALRRVGVCDFTSSRAAAKGVERFCNMVAAEILVPSEALRQRLPEAAEVDVVGLAREFKVSAEAMALRLIAAHRLPESAYENYRSRYLKDVDEERRKQREQRAVREGGPDHARLVVTNLGHRFLRLVVDAYNEGFVSAPEFKDYTSVRVTRLGKLEAMMGQGA